MVKNTKTKKTRSELFDLTLQLAAKNPTSGTTRTDVVKEFRRSHEQTFQDELVALAEIGLNVLAGRVSSMRDATSNSADLFEKNGLNNLVTLRFKGKNGKIVSSQHSVAHLNASQVLRHQLRTAKPKIRTKTENLIEVAEEMKK